MASSVATAGAGAMLAPMTIDELTGVQKAAVLCMALGREVSGVLAERLTPDEVESITLEIARLERVPPGVVDQVVEEWLETSRAVESMAGGGEEYALELLEQAFGAQRAAYIYKRIQAQLADEAALLHLRKVDSQQLAAVLRNEHPQTIALILTHLDPPQTAQILKELGPSVGALVIYRMARMEKVSPEMIQLIEQSVGSEMDLSFTQRLTSASGGPRAVAAVMNLIAPSMEKELLETIAHRDPELCEQIKNLMFVFEDIAKLDARAIGRLLREVDVKQLALALKGASDELRLRIRETMSKRAAEALDEEMEFLGPQRVRDVEAAQMGIVARVRALEESGEIVVSAGGGDEIIE